jgi:hypothetical protein
MVALRPESKRKLPARYRPENQKNTPQLSVNQGSPEGPPTVTHLLTKLPQIANRAPPINSLPSSPPILPLIQQSPTMSEPSPPRKRARNQSPNPSSAMTQSNDQVVAEPVGDKSKYPPAMPPSALPSGLSTLLAEQPSQGSSLQHSGRHGEHEQNSRYRKFSAASCMRRCLVQLNAPDMTTDQVRRPLSFPASDNLRTDPR